ncbi:hypothetical protein [Paracoccus sp. N5]|uniref:hypothetical protein n=1 Tax=Paracoccus sp. N5 TaxID=1101189 RepID=UPI0003615AAB|nr:hypothetical protein [Paracoccus sp. N5]
MGVPLFGNNSAQEHYPHCLTDDGIDKLKDMLRDARIAIETWHGFHNDFVDDQKICIKAHMVDRSWSGLTRS